MKCPVFLLLLTVLTAETYGFINSLPGNGRQAICPLPSKPCRLQVTMYHFNGTLAGEMETQTCACSNSFSCSSDWSTSDHIISRNLISHTYNMTLNMMFCQPVQPQRYCNVSEKALVVSGVMTIPQNVNQFNCRCRDNSPLLLHQRRIGADHLTYHTYVCDNHKPTCLMYISRCLAIRDDVVNYPCKCISSSFCRSQESNWNDVVTYGYCRP